MSLLHYPSISPTLEYCYWTTCEKYELTISVWEILIKLYKSHSRANFNDSWLKHLVKCPLRWLSLHVTDDVFFVTDDMSTMVQVMAWCCQAINDYLGQSWPSSMSPSGVTRPQGVSAMIRGYTPVSIKNKDSWWSCGIKWYHRPLNKFR